MCVRRKRNLQNKFGASFCETGSSAGLFIFEINWFRGPEKDGKLIGQKLPLSIKKSVRFDFLYENLIKTANFAILFSLSHDIFL
jgi:hypothetical protein